MRMLDFEIKEVKFGEKNYPKRLKGIKNPPKRLFYRGNLGVLRGRSIAIVGSRKMSRHGREVVGRFVGDFVREGVVTISGFMYGVDTEVHKETVENGGVTVAVFGCGLNVIYPPENDRLYGRILEGGGLVLSEYQPAAKPHLWKFPQRNRIVAGLSSLGVLVIEAGQKSGSLITARIAQEQGKKVYSVPGQITSSVSKGTNWLIKEGGAKLVTEVSDIVGEKRQVASGKGQDNLEGLEKKIWEALEAEALNVDEIAAAVGKNVVEVGMALSMMGIKGLIGESGGKWFCVRI